MSLQLALLLAFAFGVGYNWLIVIWERHGVEGLTSLWVVVGVLLTLGISATVKHPGLGWLALFWNGAPIRLTNAQHAALYELLFFAAAGLPMVLGSLWRHWRRM